MTITIPKLMATQHPDTTKTVKAAEETIEAIEAIKIYECDEIMIDYEGKLTPYHQPEWIVDEANKQELIPGEDFLLTIRISREELESLGRHVFALITGYLANMKAIKKGEKPPVKYIVLPMTKDALDALRMQRRILKLQRFMREEYGFTDTTTMEIIPLLEDIERQFHATTITEALTNNMARELGYFAEKIRIFLGKSDSALKNGHIASALALKTSLNKLHAWGEEKLIEIHPILGMGKPPFRGGINEKYIREWIRNWKGYSTVTIQSAIRYDTPLQEYKKTIEHLKNNAGKKTEPITPELITIITSIMKKTRQEYHRNIDKIHPHIEALYDLVPVTRERVPRHKYSRNIGEKTLPRAISFVATFYTISLPPTLLDAAIIPSLNGKELETLLEYYPLIIEELKHDLKYYEPELTEKWLPKNISDEIKHNINTLIKELDLDTKKDMMHIKLSKTLYTLIQEKTDTAKIQQIIIEMARIRGFLG